MRAIGPLAFLIALGVVAASTRADEPDPKEIIMEADRKVAALRAVSYRVETRAEGIWKDRMPRFQATVSADAGAERWDPRVSSAPPRLRIEGVVKQPGSNESRSFGMVLSGKEIMRVDPEGKTCTLGTWPEAVRLIGALPMCLLDEFLAVSPFSDELGTVPRRYEGQKTVGGTACHVIHVAYVTYNNGQREARWYFGIDDNLPHRVDRIFRSSQGHNTYVLELADINVAPKFDPATFAIRVPNGYEKKRYVYLPPSDPQLLPVGSEAPDWMLRTPEGKSISLSSLRGKVVVLDFWATWCAPCIKAMPGMQKLHERFKGKPVAIYGVNCRELASADPAAFMKEQSLTYGLLLNGEQIARAYRIVAIPVFYVIAPDGRIAYAATGYDPRREEGLASLIESLMKNID